jgi:hypothetical protein
MPGRHEGRHRPRARFSTVRTECWRSPGGFPVKRHVKRHVWFVPLLAVCSAAAFPAAAQTQTDMNAAAAQGAKAADQALNA